MIYKIKEKKKEEIEIVTKLRGVAAMMVFLFHFVCLSNGYISYKWLNDVCRYGKYGVQFFFVISGFVITYSMLKANYNLNNFFIFLKKRIIRIEPPYLIVLFLTVLFLFVRVKFGLGNGNNNLPAFFQVLLHIGYLIPFSKFQWLSIVFWTLAIEFQFYLLFSLLFTSYVFNIYLRSVIQLLLLVLFFLSKSEAHFFYWSPVFLIGINLALFKMKKAEALELLITTFLMIFVLYIKTRWEILIFSLIPFLLIFFEPQIKSRLLDFLGKISYSLYLCHTLIAFAIINLAIRFTQNFIEKIIFVSIAFSSTIFVSWLLFFFVEQPFKRIASAVKYVK